MHGDIFKAYDVRGKVDGELTPDIARLIGRAFAVWLPDDGAIAVGYDMRADSKKLAAELILGIREQGRDVIDLGLVSTDMTMFSVGKYGLAGGAMITASHNAADYNGIKFCRREARPVGLHSGLAEVRDIAIAASFDPAASPGSLEQKDIIDEWIAHVLSFVEVADLRELKIAVDAGNGMAGAIFPHLLPKVPWKVVPMYFELDGTFPNHPANPMEPKNLRQLEIMVEQEQCDIGLAFDGDGDRVALVDEKGSSITGSETLAMLAEYFLQKFPDSTIVYDVRTSRVVAEAIETNGGHGVRMPVGTAFIKDAMREHAAPFGGEAAGHFYFRDNWFGDSGLIAAVVAIAVVTKSGKKLSELIAGYRQKYVSIPETNFVVTDKDAALKRLAAEFESGDQDWLDGLTISWPDAWFNVRASNTEPLLRLNCEAMEANRLNGLVTKISALLPQE